VPTSSLLRISDAASLGLHAVVVLAGADGELISTESIATKMGMSSNHLAKVLQRLSRAGLVEAVRGPHGGFRLGQPAENIRLMDVYEAIEGPVRPGHCILGQPMCGRKRCIMGNLVETVQERFIDYFSKTSLADLVETEDE